ncbi:MAG: phosphoglycolate phosphatase [Pseudomonadota bacterium]
MDSSKIAAVLFDLDGTLVHSAPDMVAAANWLRAQGGLEPVDGPWLSQYVSKGGAGVVGAAFPDASPVEQAELLGRFLARYGENLSEKSGLFPGVADLLTMIESHDWPWGVVTNKASIYAEPLMDSLGLRVRCAALICGDTLPTRKPAPDGLLEACRRMGVAPESCVYVGDDQRDIQAARAAGCAAVAAAYGYFTPDDHPVTWGADAVIQEAHELPALLGLALSSGESV